MDEYKVRSILRKRFPTIWDKYNKDLNGYIGNLSTTTDDFAIEVTTKYIINLMNKENEKVSRAK